MKINLWVLGSLEHKIIPTEATCSRLQNIISKFDNEGEVNLVSTPDLEVWQLNTDFSAGKCLFKKEVK